MLKKDLIKAVAEASGHTQDTVRQVFEGIESVVLDAFRSGRDVMLLGLGKLSVRRRPPRRARNMQTGEGVTVPERNVIQFKASSGATRAANGKDEG